ncbi:MAG: VWA domain-containing protein [Planctomycetia bacterium]|nr:VWA domain-containing protein [Planctomycetia bacterium]
MPPDEPEPPTPPTPPAPPAPPASTKVPPPQPQVVEAEGLPESTAETESGEKSTVFQTLESWRERMLSDRQKLASRNVVLRVLFGLGVVAIFAFIVWIHQMTIGKYAVLKNIAIMQNPCNQGQMDISFEVVTPGKVYCRRESGDVLANLIDVYHEPGRYRRPWNWSYEPGKTIDISIWSRSTIFRVRSDASFPTADTIDVVILIDATGSMDNSLNELKEKCSAFAKMLEQQSLQARFALVGFGDTQEGEWVETLNFTSDIQVFQRAVENIKRYGGGVDLEESALDALIEGVKLIEKGSKRNSIRRFYLVTDESFHPQTAQGNLDAAAVGKVLRENGVHLDVFCRPAHRDSYAPLLGEQGNFMEIENFGDVLAQGRVLED